MKYLNCIVLIGLFGSTGCSNENQLKPPPYHLSIESDLPTAFGGGKIKTLNGINFSLDGKTLYVSQQREKKARNGRSFAGIFRYDYKEEDWHGPILIEFTKEIDAYHPVLSVDNKAVFFNSRSHPDTLDRFIPHNIWYAEKTKDGWSAPQMLEGVNSEFYDSYPSVAKNGNLYFNSDRPGGKGGMDIYLSHYKDGHYQQPINLEVINSADAENDLVVDPEERFLIFNRYLDSTKEIDLYVSYRQGHQWQPPIPLDKINAPNQWELTPTLSPDGKYFFYELDNKIMQISMSKLVNQD